jgi:hypothetical protein
VTGMPERSLWLRLALRAYPRRWRETRENELLGVLHDSIPPQRRWPGLRVLLDLVLSGWRTRLRNHPPIVPWLAYRLSRRSLDTSWRAWVADDLDGNLWWMRSSATAYLVLAVMSSGVGLSLGFTASGLVVLLLIVTAGSFFWRHRRRRRARSKYLETVPMWTWMWTWVWTTPQLRTRVTPFLTAIGWALIASAAVGAWLPTSASAQSIGRRLEGGSGVARLHHLATVESIAAAAGLVCSGLIMLALRRRVPRRLATRRPGSIPPRRYSSWLVRGVGVGLFIAEVVLLGLGWGPPVLIALGLGAGPALIALARVAARSERSLGLDVTWRDCRLAMSRRGAGVEPEVARWQAMPQVAQVEGPLPEFAHA